MRVAGKGTRLGNYIADTIVLFLIIMLHAIVLDGMFHLIPEDGSPYLGLYFFLLYFAYYFLFEYFFGRTPGKWITGTRVTALDERKPTPRQLFTRNICRLIPLDNLSFLFSGTGWHDSLSGTQVVHTNKAG